MFTGQGNVNFNLVELIPCLFWSLCACFIVVRLQARYIG